MPIYEYEREDGTVFEINQRITDEPLTCCPETGQSVQRLISRSAFQLKGGGWYADGYSSAKAGNGSSKSLGTCADGKSAGNCACANAAASGSSSSGS